MLQLNICWSVRHHVECLWLCQDHTSTTTLFYLCVFRLEVDLWLPSCGDFLPPSDQKAHYFLSIIFVFCFQHLVVHLAKLCLSYSSPQTWKLKSLETLLASSRAAFLSWGQFYPSTCSQYLIIPGGIFDCQN